MRQGAKLMFLSLVVFPFSMMLGIFFDTPGFLVIPFTMFFAGLSWAGYVRLFIEGTPGGGTTVRLHFPEHTGQACDRVLELKSLQQPPEAKPIAC